MDILQGLDREQAAAATAPQGALLVMAGAGTGKTTTLTGRIAWLLGTRGLPPQSVMAVTFTNRAARELRERVALHVGELASGLRLGTFHGLSARILRRHAEAAGLRGPDFTVADEDEARHLMAMAAQVPGAYGPFTPAQGLDESGLKAARKEWEAGLRDFAARAARQVSLWKGWGLTAAQASDPARPDRSPDEERMAAAYGAYQYELEIRNMADFGDLLLKVVSLFRSNPSALDAEASAIRHLLVDEGQDANPVQVEWARMLSSVHGGITVVGDEDQNIFGFQGGYPGAMRDMAGPSAMSFSLTVNRRCTEEILRPANLAVDYNRRAEPKSLVSGRRGQPVRATGHSTDASEAAWIAARIAELVEGGADPAGIAVLFRTSHAIAPYEEALARKGVRTSVASGKSLLDREEARDVMAMVRIALNPHDGLSFGRLAARPPRGLGTSAVESITALAAKRGIPLHEACIAACDQRSGIGLRKDARAGAAELGRALSMLHDSVSWNRHAYDVLATGLAETGYWKWLESQDSAVDRFMTVEAVQRLSEAYESAADFLLDMSLLTDAEPLADSAGKVRLSTMHSVKGLEFDHVFCPAFDEGVMPNERAVEEGRKGRPGDPWDGPRGGGVEEERRLAHVAFTRARHGLDVSFAWRRVGKGGKGRAGGPSSFMEECELKWQDVGSASTADLGRKKARKKSGRMGFDR